MTSFGYQILGFGAGDSAAKLEFDYLVVGGGGGSGSDDGGGGGGGGFRTSFPGGTKVEVTSGDPITVGLGGNASTGPSPAATSGGDSTAGAISSTGGGGGGNPGQDGLDGGSGGGGALNGSGGSGNAGSYTPAEGKDGGGGGGNNSGGGVDNMLYFITHLH